MNAKQPEPSGLITISDRKTVSMNGVIDVLSFDETGVTLSTALGMLSIEGEELRVKKMDIEAGIVALEGTINGVFYFERTASPRRGLFGRRK